MTNDTLTDCTAQLVAEARRLGLECQELLDAVQYYFHLSREGSDAPELAGQETKIHLAMSDLLGRVNAYFLSRH